MLELLSMRDMHRVCTESAERYGPIFKWRLFTFHVASCAPLLLDPALSGIMTGHVEWSACTYQTSHILHLCIGPQRCP